MNASTGTVESTTISIQRIKNTSTFMIQCCGAGGSEIIRGPGAGVENKFK